MANYEREAIGHLQEAVKKANYTGWFGGNKLDEAAELYAKAANSFKLAKKWQEAGDAYISQANVMKKLNETDEAASSYLNASKCYKKTNPLDAINALQKAVEILVERGRFQSAASNQKQIAEIYENEIIDPEKTLHAYELAADWYTTEESNAQANACWLKVAHYAAQLEQYQRAIEKFEAVAEASKDNSLTRWSLRTYFLNAGICRLCTGDLVATQGAIDRYLQMDTTFSTAREYSFLKALFDACEANDTEAFTAAIIDFDKITKLDPWKTSLLLKVKNSLANDEQDFT
ncbi:soluble NSF attachment protein [Polychytrium aggregatum]|uniref:soluble NSF attachment protein n=1 Tax=Polychytrium aggregatum TaxID=110093 RepID=UPI0022FF15DA|nr:soluble NSF attachment protein [Polychytrium aggregatum]KAI9203067.1 soluble NSF attachment protein [Polychytrium aggregatum]